jgi:thiol:disulfide interchange protein
MIRILLFALVCAGPLAVNAQTDNAGGTTDKPDKPAKAHPGIQFFQGTWEEALAESAKTGKPIFLDAYAPWCGPCKLLDKRVFTQERAGEFFNEHFINVQLDVDSKELNGAPNPNIAVGDKYGVRAYPSLFIINSDGTMKASALGYMDVDKLIEFGKTGL